MNIVHDVATHPVLTTIAGMATATVGALNNFAPDLPLVHDLLSDGAMLIGILTAAVGLAVQLRIWKIKGMEQVKLQQEIDKGRRDELRAENAIYVPNKTPADMVVK